MKNSYRVSVWLAVACSLVVAGMAFTLWSYQQIAHASDQRHASRDAISAATQFMNHLQDAETGQRGYALTGEEAYLQPYMAVHNSLRGDLQALRQRNTNAAAQAHLDAAVPLLEATLVEMGRVIALRRAHDMGALMALVNRGEGKRSMDAIRAELIAFNRLQDEVQQQEMALFDASMRRMLATIVFIGVLLLLLALYVVYANYRVVQQRMRNAVYQETQHLLKVQTESNRQLLLSNRDLQISQAELAASFTREHAALQASRDSASLVQAILNTVVDGVVTVHANDAHIQSANAATERMFGYSAQELTGQTFDLLIPELDQIPSDALLGHLLAGHNANPKGQVWEGAGRRKDGSVFPLEVAVGEMALGGERYFTAMLHDITARKQAETALRKTNAIQFAIFRSSHFSCIATDAQGVIQVFNVGAESMLGYSAASMIGQTTPASICDPHELMARAQLLRVDYQAEVAPGFETLVFNASRGVEDVFELTYLHHDGSAFPMVVSVTALRDDAWTIVGYLLIGFDNRTRRRLEVERFHLDQVLRDRNLELEAARAVADRKNQAKSDFLSRMSHELRSPLNAILGFAQLLESGVPPPTPTQKASIEQVLKAGWYLLELINEVLDLALVESGRLSLSIEPVNLPEVLADCRTMMEPLADKRGIQLQFPATLLPTFVEADRTRVKQVIVNLLSNAIKYNRPHGLVEVTCTPAQAGRLQIRIRDSGCGLSPVQCAQLFQPFNRLGQESGKEEGTGIGLTVSKRLVELMAGSIGVVSNPGEGSEFWIELNLAAPPVVSSTPKPSTRPLALQAPPQGMSGTVLYVEDNLANMDLMAQLIARRPGLRLLRAEDGIRGVAVARTEQPDLIVMDINLPGMGGLQVLEILRANPATQHIPVIALSANAMPHDMKMALEAGFVCYLTKPIRLGEFMDALEAGFALSHAGVATIDANDLSAQPS